MSGRQRKWVSWGFGGIDGLEEGERVWKALVRVELYRRRFVRCEVSRRECRGE